MKNDDIRDLYNGIAQKYNENRSKASNDVSEFPKVIELAGDVKGKNVLDLGCGLGKHSKEYLNKGAIVTGIDASDEMIKIAKKTCENRGNFFVANFEDVKFDDETFDLISASFSIMYSDKIDYLFKQFHAWLRPQGRVIFSIYHPIQYFLKIEDFDFTKSKKYWFKLNAYDVEVYNYYHPIGDYCNSFLSNGFKLKSLNETTISRKIKGWAEEKYRIPNSIVFEIEKV